MKRIRNFTSSARFFILVSLTVAVAAARASDYYVYVDEAGFDPNYLEVQVGDTVYWYNVDSFGDSHTTHCPSYPWYGYLANFGSGGFLTVTKIGTFSYYDDFTAEFATLVVNPVTPQPPPPPGLTDPVRLANGSFQFTVTNLVAGKTNIIEASNDLVNWTGLATNVAGSDSYVFTDNGAAAVARRYYRAAAKP